ncbi:MAG: hypothetical protein M0T77_00025 [Actinomycetota bacterium]|nr:hypothetical protein [Actinomycetota bacterium]
MRRAQIGRTDQPVVPYGLRGVGKTVLLSEFRRMASSRRWVVAQIEAGTGKALRELLGEALYEPLSDLARPGAGRRLLKALNTALSFKASYDLTARGRSVWISPMPLVVGRTPAFWTLT